MNLPPGARRHPHLREYLTGHMVCDPEGPTYSRMATKELENRYQRVFQEMNVNTLTKQVQ